MEFPASVHNKKACPHHNGDFGASLGIFAYGGEGGIRTHGTLAGTTVFKTAAINHSTTSPDDPLALILRQARHSNKIVPYCCVAYNVYFLAITAIPPI